MSLSENIRSIRIKRGYTQKQLAEMADISESMLSLYESGKRVPRFSTVKRISDALGTEYESLLSDDAGSRIVGADELSWIFGGDKLIDFLEGSGSMWHVQLCCDHLVIANDDGLSASLSDEESGELLGEFRRFIDFRLREFCREKARVK